MQNVISGIQVLVISEFEKMKIRFNVLNNSEQFQLIVPASLLLVVLLRGKEDGEYSTIWVKEEDCSWRREILTQLNTVFCTSITATL
jgi:hypothetical protein